MIIQPIINIADICARHNIDQAVISPGSRSALLTLAFARHEKIRTFVVPDERSAGYIALGLAQSSNKPVVIVCTSGTAVANLYPAIIEAFYQQIPLLVFTADRPPEWIDQQDGQTIRQQNIYQNHILDSFQFPVSFEHEDAVWHSERMISEAILKTQGIMNGPVHVNVPVREPFYPGADEKFDYSQKVKVFDVRVPEIASGSVEIQELLPELEKYEKIMVLAGQAHFSDRLLFALNNIQKKLKWVFVGDITANLAGMNHFISKHDIILQNKKINPDLAPDLLITIGSSVLSKRLKGFIRDEDPSDHWHIGGDQQSVDSFKSLTRLIRMTPERFFSTLERSSPKLNKQQNSFFNTWTEYELSARTFAKDFFKSNELSEFHAVEKILANLPQQCHVHLANSMPVRYANLIGVNEKINVSIWSNRGTSGIDGCLSTSVGHAINSSLINVMITGDMAFFYDRNGLWHRHTPKNLRIIVLNNHGGGIFRMIDGPKQLDELEEYFETHQKLNAANTARDFGLKYYHLNNLEILAELLVDFFKEENGPSILEIETRPEMNQKIFEDFNQKAAQLWK